MPFQFTKVLEHGTTNPIVARLSLQILQILTQCNASKDIQDKVGDLYMNSLQKKLLRCWEIEERFKKEYGTTFVEASEFSRAKKGIQSLVEFAEKTFGADDGKTKFLKEAVPSVEELIAMRNAVEHPEGLSGKLVIVNFTLGADRKKDGKLVAEPSSIRADMKAYIHNLLTLGEDVFVSWASDHLQALDMMRIAYIPEDKRNPTCPIKWTVTLNQRLEDLLAKATMNKT
jgi:hypothetical protein